LIEAYIRNKLESCVLVVSFGSQYSHMIARRVRELNTFSSIISYTDFSREVVEELEPCAIILSSGPYSVLEPDHPRIGSWLLEIDRPILGVGYAAHLLAELMGGSVRGGVLGYGRVAVKVVREDPLLSGWAGGFAWNTRDECVVEVPGAETLAVTSEGCIAAFKARGRPVYGLQFHPEVKHAEGGMKIVENFVHKIARCERGWYAEDLIPLLVESIRRQVGVDEKVLVATSGGLDSTVTAMLVKRAVGDRLVPVLVNHGLFRLNEVDEIRANLAKAGIEPLYIDASERFLKKLEGTVKCEDRRRIIGEEFAHIFKEIAESDPSIKWLAQGTIYPDVVESGFTPHSSRVKSHHNVAALPSWLGLGLIEPLKYFYKDEVRAIGRKLGIPEEILKRHPFPGPGLAARIIGEFTREKLEIARRASHIVEDVLRKHGLYDKVWQAFAVVGDDKWVGVKSEKRVDGYVVTVRVVESEDGMTADYSRIPYTVLEEISSRITREIRDVTMVTYAITTKPPSTIEPC